MEKRSTGYRGILPPLSSGVEALQLPPTRQITIVGGAGAGKSLFMQEMIRLCGSKAYCLSALKGGFAQRDVSIAPGSIDAQFREAVRTRSYMRNDAVSELDKLAYMLFTDEFESLLKIKENKYRGLEVKYRPTKLDKLINLWQRIFPDSRIVRSSERLMFSTAAGDDLIGVGSLSQGETAVLYYIAAVLYARQDSVIFIDQPSQFIHPSVVELVWDSLEELRPDCTFVYDTVDVDFVSSRTENVCVWVKSYDSAMHAWDYELLTAGNLSEEFLVGLVGSRKPVLFIEGDVEHSIDAKLYRLVFTGYTVRPLGSCNKVIETTRSFNDLRQMHHLESHGIVDRDRRTADEVAYLRRKSIFVPEVAEVENIFLLPEVIRVMARRRAKDGKKILEQVKRNVLKSFSQRYDEQALQHVRHRVKREVECKIDGRFTCITAMETHLNRIADQLRPRENYEALRAEFLRMTGQGDYVGVLRVYNHKPLLGESGVDRMLGYGSAKDYIAGVLASLKGNTKDAQQLRAAIKYCFGLGSDDEYLEPLPPPETKAEKRKRIRNSGLVEEPEKRDRTPAESKHRKKKKDARKREKKRAVRSRRRVARKTF